MKSAIRARMTSLSMLRRVLLAAGAAALAPHAHAQCISREARFDGPVSLSRPAFIADRDGPGPMMNQAFAIDGTSILYWTGSRWSHFTGLQPLQWASPFTLKLETLWDPDGIGPLLPRFVVSGNFTQIGGVQAQLLAQWDGLQWAPLGSLSGAGLADLRGARSIDTDGDPESPPPLIAYGTFGSFASQNIRGVAAWNGETWSQLGTPQPTHASVKSIGLWDFDGDGPEPRNWSRGAPSGRRAAA